MHTEKITSSQITYIKFLFNDNSQKCIDQTSKKSDNSKRIIFHIKKLYWEKFKNKYIFIYVKRYLNDALL